MKLQNLLERWAELEPKWCKKNGSNVFWSRSGQTDYLCGIVPEKVDSYGWAKLQRMIQEAIVTHGLRLTLVYEPSEEKWRCRLFCTTDMNFREGMWFNGDDGEATIAVLTAYLQWLEYCAHQKMLEQAL